MIGISTNKPREIQQICFFHMIEDIAFILMRTLLSY